MGALTRLPVAVAPRDDVSRWLRGNLLEAATIAVGAVLAARLIGWIGQVVTRRIDSKAREGDSLVRSESAKHGHAVAQVLSYVAVVLVYVIGVFLVLKTLGVPITGFVAPATVAGVALGFGAQRVVQDILAGFFIITERQYGYGDLISLAVAGVANPRIGTVEDVTLRVTTIRAADGNVILTPNGQIVQVTNLSRDWAQVVIDVPIPASIDVDFATEVLQQVGHDLYEDEHMHTLLLDAPTVMGVESIGVGNVNIRMVARTLPGKQFEVGRALRRFIAAGLANSGIENVLDVRDLAARAAKQ
ncbi:MAG TPA: mechanosensitive ion channel family protein [Mycobacteriales bacterium]|nr:mechanosensitive ion channel family protein [Mycobacteriales bacterium]